MVAAIEREPYSPPREQRLRIDRPPFPPEPPDDDDDDFDRWDNDRRPPRRGWTCFMFALLATWVVLAILSVEFDIKSLKPLAGLLCTAIFLSIPALAIYALGIGIWSWWRREE